MSTGLPDANTRGIFGQEATAGTNAENCVQNAKIHCV